jgi:hypothetical protein
MARLLPGHFHFRCQKRDPAAIAPRDRPTASFGITRALERRILVLVAGFGSPFGRWQLHSIISAGWRDAAPPSIR